MSLYESGVRAKIDEHLLAEAKKERDYGEYWSASSAGYCMRKLIFERLGVPKNNDDARRQRVFTSGHIFHDWIQEITRNAGISLAQEMELQDEELMIRGHFDDLIILDEKVILYDYKTVNSRSFMWAKKNGNAMSHFHRMQLGTYMYMLRNNSQKMLNDIANMKYDAWKFGIGASVDVPKIPVLEEARILKIEKDALMMGEQQLMWSPELEKDVVSFWRTLNGYWKKKTMPKCTCADYEWGFMAKEQYNGYYYDGEPCSMELYKKWKEKKT